METPEPMPEPAEPRGPLGSFDEILTAPLSFLERARAGKAPLALLAGGAILGTGLYGAAAGFFQGGWQILMAAFKAPLIVAMSLLLCLPSLYVLSSLAGARWTRRSFLAVVTGFATTLSFLLLALLPIGWLFSVSSRYLGSVVWLHLLLWFLALILGWRFLGRALEAAGAHGGTFVWLLLFFIVSLQVTTFLRPVLWRPAGAPLFHIGEKMFFLEHLGKAFDMPAVDAKPEKPKTPETAKTSKQPAAR
jgi:hypothetical protein